MEEGDAKRVTDETSWILLGIPTTKPNKMMMMMMMMMMLMEYRNYRDRVAGD
jgi:hypothetical protein